MVDIWLSELLDSLSFPLPKFDEDALSFRIANLQLEFQKLWALKQKGNRMEEQRMF